MSESDGIVFGALAPKLYRQLHTPPSPDLERLQAHADAITRLMIAGLLSDAEAHRARRRLAKRIAKTIKGESR